MLKAVGRSTPPWLALQPSRELAVGVYLSRILAEQRLLEALARATLGTDWRYRAAKDVDDISKFWQGWSPGTDAIDWENSDAHRLVRDNTAGMGLVRVSVFGVEIKAEYLERFLGPKTDEWLLATRAKIIAEEPKITLRPLAAKIFPMMVKAVEAGENIELLKEATIPSYISRLLKRKSG